MKKENSIAAGIKGVQAPGPMVRKKLSEAEQFEALAAYCEATGEDLEEVVRKKGDFWAIFDDKTGVEKGVYPKRSDAWKRQRDLRLQNKTKAKNKKSSKGAQPKPSVKPITTPKPKTKKENFLFAFKEKMSKILKEGSALSYVFEQSPMSKDSVYWENFLERLSQQTILSDPQLKGILHEMAKSEVQLLAKSVGAIKSVLEDAGIYTVNQGKVDQDPAGDLILNFDVQAEGGKKLVFGVKVDNGRPLIQFPDDTKAQLNASSDENTKRLRAMLMFAQEDTLDNMNEVVDLTAKRDEYLQAMQEQVDEVLHGLNPVKMAMVRFLLKTKYKGLK